MNASLRMRVAREEYPDDCTMTWRVFLEHPEGDGGVDCMVRGRGTLMKKALVLFTNFHPLEYFHD